MNMAGLETFGDALGGIPGGTDSFFVTESFAFHSGMFDGVLISCNNLSGYLTSLNQGPAIGFSQESALSTGRIGLTDLPGGLAADVVAYLGRGGGDYDVTASPGLIDYAAAQGIDPSQLILDTENSYLAFENGEFIDGTITYNYFAEYRIPLAPGAVYGLGRQKVTENMTPIPTDRLIFDYSYFHNVPLPYRNMPVQRFTPGFEKTFFDKKFSIEMRFPFVATIDNELSTDNNNALNVTRWGDATAVLKWLVFKQKHWAMTLGLGVSLPFAEDTRLFDAPSGREVIRSEHESVHLMPYVGLLFLPNDRVFLQGYFQVDAAASGDPTYVGDLADQTGRRMIYAGKARERTYAYTSLSAGYWLFRHYARSGSRRDSHNGSLRRGMNVMGELHWTQSLDRASGVQYEQDNFRFDIGSDRANYSVLDLTLGTRFLFSEKTSVGLGYSVPLSNDHQFDGEMRLSLNRYF